MGLLRTSKIIKSLGRGFSGHSYIGTWILTSSFSNWYSYVVVDFAARAIGEQARWLC
jgi:hypothetical protein